ncbi:hypothetical protein GCM10009700_27550 [Brevibacterium sanguinis]
MVLHPANLFSPISRLDAREEVFLWAEFDKLALGFSVVEMCRVQAEVPPAGWKDAPLGWRNPVIQRPRDPAATNPPSGPWLKEWVRTKRQPGAACVAHPKPAIV